MGLRSRRKGANGEREVCRLLRDMWGVLVDRLLGQARDGGADVFVRPYRIEVKRRRRISALRYLEQATAAAKPGERAVSLLREDGGRWAVLTWLDDWAPIALPEVVAHNPEAADGG